MSLRAESTSSTVGVCTVRAPRVSQSYPTEALPGSPSVSQRLSQTSTGLPVSPELSHYDFSTFLGTSHAVPYFLRRFLECDLSEIVSEVYVLLEAVIKQYKKKHRTGASPESPTTVKHT